MLSSAAADAGTSNFLLPNGTFLAELLLFLIVFAVIWKFVVAPIQRVLAERADLIQGQMREAEAARERMREAEAHYTQSLHEARAEATRIREAAREKGQQTIDDACREAQAEADRVLEEGRAQLAVEREALAGQLRMSIGSLALELADRTVGEPVGGESEWRSTVEPFLGSITMVDGRLQSREPGQPSESRHLTSGGVS